MAERLTEAGCSVVDFYSLVPSEDHTIRLMFRRANTDEWFSYDIGELEYNVPMWYTERGAELRIAELVEHGFEVMRPTT